MIFCLWYHYNDMATYTANEIDSLLETSGLKRTRGRIAVLHALRKAHKPIAIEDLHTSLTEPIHFVTLYRMLKQFVDAGIVYQTDLRSGKAYYELQREHHHHITCTKCGHQEEFSICANPLLNDISKKSKDFEDITSHTFELFSVCNSCQRST